MHIDCDIFQEAISDRKFCFHCGLAKGLHTIEKTVQNQPKRNPHFHAILQEMADIHDKKSQDYAAQSNVYSNFEKSARFAGITVEQGILNLIGTKIARLENLHSKIGTGVGINYESLDDTVSDLTVYLVIFQAYKRYLKEQQYDPNAGELRAPGQNFNVNPNSTNK